MLLRQNIIAALAKAFVSVVFVVRLPAACDPVPDPLKQARHLAAAAAAVAVGAVAVVAAAADREPRAFFLAGRALPPAPPHPGARSADGRPVVRLREIGPAQLLP